MPNSSGTFLSANDDQTRTLAEIEKKIARATMIPRSHGEVLHDNFKFVPYFVVQLFQFSGSDNLLALGIYMSSLSFFFLFHFLDFF